MDIEWWNNENAVAAFMAEESSVCTAALLPCADKCWIVSETSSDPLSCNWTQVTSCPEHARAVAVFQEEQARQAAWHRLLQASSPVEWFCGQKQTDTMEREGRVGREGAIVVDRTVALAFCALSFSAVRNRSQRQGITAIYAGEDRLTAFLVFQNRFWGILEHVSTISSELLLDDLKEFRLGWLPDEIVRIQGGYSAVLSEAMPPQAEGFVPTFVFGPRKNQLASYGKLLESAMGAGYAECRGLLYGLALGEASFRLHL